MLSVNQTQNNMMGALKPINRFHTVGPTSHTHDETKKKVREGKEKHRKYKDHEHRIRQFKRNHN